MGNIKYKPETSRRNRRESAELGLGQEFLDLAQQAWSMNGKTVNCAS
jgi:hypothetical protein